MFHDWENYYLLIGAAAGALIGLVFVVTTLTAGLDASRVSRGAKVYITPIVFHFSVVLIVSAISAVWRLESCRMQSAPPCSFCC
jgi:formate/nitrite transporter FocA (FNT family)